MLSVFISSFEVVTLSSLFYKCNSMYSTTRKWGIFRNILRKIVSEGIRLSRPGQTLLRPWRWQSIAAGCSSMLHSKDCFMEQLNWLYWSLCSRPTYSPICSCKHMEEWPLLCFASQAYQSWNVWKCAPLRKGGPPVQRDEGWRNWAHGASCVNFPNCKYLTQTAIPRWK